MTRKIAQPNLNKQILHVYGITSALKYKLWVLDRVPTMYVNAYMKPYAHTLTDPCFEIPRQILLF